MPKFINAKSPLSSIGSATNSKDSHSQLFSLAFENGRITAIEPQSDVIKNTEAMTLAQLSASPQRAIQTSQLVIDLQQQYLLPAGIDVHVHSREPGLTHKETWKSMAQSAFHGGVTSVVDMPNTIPAMMDEETTRAKAAIAGQSGLNFQLLLGVGAGNVHRLREILQNCKQELCGIKVFYGQSTGQLMFDNLELLDECLPRHQDFQIVFHSEDQCRIDHNLTLYQDHLQDTEAGSFNYHSLIRDSQAAIDSTIKIVEWAKKKNRRMHLAHVSTAREVELVRDAKKSGLAITCEVAPHHLFFSTDDYPRLGSILKVNPPIRTLPEVKALQHYFAEGWIDMWATDHAPHTSEEKSQSLAKAPSGIASVELFFPLLFEAAERFGLPLDKAIAMATSVPAKEFGFSALGNLQSGYNADFTVIAHNPWKVRQKQLLSKCGISPYDHMTLKHQVVATWKSGTLGYISPADTLSEKTKN